MYASNASSGTFNFVPGRYSCLSVLSSQVSHARGWSCGISERISTCKPWAAEAHQAAEPGRDCSSCIALVISAAQDRASCLAKFLSGSITGRLLDVKQRINTSADEVPWAGGPTQHARVAGSGECIADAIDRSPGCTWASFGFFGIRALDGSWLSCCSGCGFFRFRFIDGSVARYRWRIHASFGPSRIWLKRGSHRRNVRDSGSISQ